MQDGVRVWTRVRVANHDQMLFLVLEQDFLVQGKVVTEVLTTVLVR